MSRAPPLWRRALRALGYGLLAVLALLSLVALCLSLVLASSRGRAWLLASVVTELNRVLPGKVSAGRLDRLGLGSVTLSDVNVRAPAGNEVLRLRTLHAALHLWPLARGRLVFSEVDVQSALVDLRSWGASPTSLVSAFVRPAPAEPGPPSTPPPISFELLQLADVKIELPSAGSELAGLEAEISRFEGALSITPVLGLKLQALDAELRRGRERLGSFGARGQFDERQASRVELVAHLCEMDLELSATVGARARRSVQNAPFEVQLSLREVTSARLARLLGRANLAATGLAPTSLALQLSGDAKAWQANAQVTSNGGTLVLDGTGHELQKLDLDVRTEQLRLGAVASSLPSWQLDTNTSLSLERRAGSPELRLEAQSNSALNGVALPRARLGALATPRGLEQLDVRLDTGASTARVGGHLLWRGGSALRAQLDLELESALRVLGAFGVRPPDVKGRLDGDIDLERHADGAIGGHARLRIPSAGGAAWRIDDLHAEASLGGLPQAPTVDLSADWQGGRAASQDLAAGQLRASGGPSRYTFSLDAAAPRANATLALSGWLERQAPLLRVAARASGTLQHAAWQLDLQPIEIQEGGRVQLRRAELTFAEQHATLQGSYAPRAADLRLSFENLELARALRPFWPELTLGGTLSGHVRAHGDLERPALQVELTGQRLVRGSAPPLDAKLRATLDAARGRFALEARAVEHPGAQVATPGLDARLEAHSQFSAGRDWSRDWLRGSTSASLELTRLDTRLVHEFVARVPDVEGTLRGKVLFSIQEGRPKFTAELALDDARGRWLRSNADFAVEDLRAGNSGRESLELRSLAWRTLLERARWNIALHAEPRNTQTLPLPSALIEQVPSRVSMDLELTHEPQAEPSGKLELVLVSDGSASTGFSEGSVSPGLNECTPSELKAHASLSLGGGEFRAEVLAQHASANLLRARSEGHLELVPILRGAPFVAPHLQVSVEADALPLAELPFVCARLHGVVGARGQLDDPLGASPHGSFTLQAKDFSFGSEQTLGLDGTLQLTPTELALAASITSGGRTSALSAHLPLERQGHTWRLRKEAPLEAELDAEALPIAAFLSRNGPLSAASGTIEGRLHVAGTSDLPQLDGELRLRDAALTVTALAQPLEGVNGELSVEKDVLVLKHGSARDGSGSLSLNGRLSRDHEQTTTGSFDLQANKFPLRQGGQIVAVTTATAHVELTLRPGARDVRVQLDKFDTWLEGKPAHNALSLEPNPDVVIEDRSAAARPPPPPRPSSTRLSVQIDASQQFSVRRSDFGVQLSAALHVVVAPPTPPAIEPSVSVTGKLEFTRGHLELLGEMFTIQRGSLLRFSGSPDPTLDITARYADQRSKQTLRVHVRGTASAPKLDFLLDDTPVTAAEAMQTLYGSTSANETSASALANGEDNQAEAEAKQFAGALTAGVLTASIRKRFGAMAPIVSIQPSSSQSNAQVRAGFELDPLIPSFLRGVVTGVYVEGILGSEKDSAQEQQTVQGGIEVEVYFPYHLFASGVYGPGATWSFDAGWQP